MPIRGRIAVDDQGRLVMIDPSADRESIDAADIQPLYVDDLNLSGQLTGESGRTVYDDSTETVGDGQTSADHESVNTAQTNYTGITDGTIFQAQTFDSEDTSDQSDVGVQFTKSVSTTATEIFNRAEAGTGGLASVFGRSGSSTYFQDLVIYVGNGGASSIATATRGGPPGRTYTVNNNELQLAMDSGTYDINVIGFQQFVPA